MSLSPTAEWALYYRRAGWRVFPIKRGEKRPIYDGWQSGATTDPDLIERYFSDARRNIAVVCGEQFDAWDIEVEHVKAFSGWMLDNGYQLPENPMATTGRLGLHYLTAPTGVNGTRYLWLNGEHIGELKSTGGFILVAPSVTENQYRWMWHPYHLTVQPAPDWLLGLLERPKTVKRLPTRLATPADVVAVLGALAGSVAHAGEGNRNNYLYWALRRALEEGVPAPQAIEVLRAAALEAGLDRHETDRTIESAVEAESEAA